MPENPPVTGIPTPPLVFVSYARKDEKWRDRVHLSLQPAVAAGTVSLWDDKFLEAGDEWNVKIEEAITTAAVAVLLVSPDYLASDWIIKGEAPRLLDLMDKGRLRVVPLLLRPCDWHTVPWLRNIQMFPHDAKPITLRPRTAQDTLFNEAAVRIVRLATGQAVSPAPSWGTSSASPRPEERGEGKEAPAIKKARQPDELTIDDLSDLVLSDETRKLLGHARILATFGSEKQPKVTTSCLFFGIAEGGHGQTSRGTPRFLLRELTRADAKGYTETFQERFPDAKYSGSSLIGIDFDRFTQKVVAITPNVLGVFRHAKEISEAVKSPVESNTGKQSEISPEHLLASLLTLERTGAIERLSRIIDAAILRRKFLNNFVYDSLPDDNLEAWKELLDPEVAQDPATPAEVQDDFRAALPGFLTDYWIGEDLLGITSEVNAFASLVAACSVDPPLSIGLFGDWGSGKTHFMRQMKARVEKLSQKAQDSGEPQNKLAYYKNIVQIEFNAWHYIEGNLWASLVEHIFENLSVPNKNDSEEDGKAQVEAARLALMDQLGLKKEVQAKVEERKEELKIQEKAAEGRAEKAKTQAADKSQDLVKLQNNTDPNLINQLTNVELSAAQKELLEGLGIPAGMLLVPAEIHRRYEETQTFWSKLKAQWNLFRADKKLFKKSIRVFIVVFATAVVSLLAWKYITSAYKYIASVVTFVLTLVGAAKSYYDKFKKGMATLKVKHDQIEQERQKQLITLENEVRERTKQYTAAEDEAKTINKEVAALQLQLDEISVSKLLAGFIEDRAACSDYRRHLGVLALIRRDFEKLSELLSAQRKVHREEAAAENAQAIDRIILYIDDLDRCPPERVVQVLQAVHLLLAFPLFVVVVGVDARWVSHSLRESYEWLVAENDDDDEKETHGDKKEQAEAHIATPHDYLEKIFQIPFWLKPMDDDACRKLVDGITKDSRVMQSPQNGGADLKAPVAPISENHAEATLQGEADVQTAEAVPAGGLVRDVQSQSPLEVPADLGVAGEPNAAAEAEPLQNDANVSHGQGIVVTTADAGGGDDPDSDPIDLVPESLTLADKEIDYMKELTRLIGRSPRSVKRFLNCYRLIKVGLRSRELGAFLGPDGQGGEFKAVMILLGLITGAPSISLYFIEELEKSQRKGGINLDDFLVKLEENPEVSRQSDWIRVRDFLGDHIGSRDSRETLAALIRNAPRVSRYSFKVARVEAAVKRRAAVSRRNMTTQTTPAGTRTSQK